MSFDLKLGVSQSSHLPPRFFKRLSELGHRAPVFIETAACALDKTKNNLMHALATLNADYEFIDGHCLISQDKHIKSLGLETTHIILNITQGLDIRALLAITGKIKAGYCLFILMPSRHNLNAIWDATSTRWFNYSYDDILNPVQAPNFYTYLSQIIEQTVPLIVLNEQTDFLSFFNNYEYIPHDQSNPSLFAKPSSLTETQSNVINDLKRTTHHLSLLCAKRGRGKSYTVAHWISYLYESNISFMISAPRKSLFKFDDKTLDNFLAPDELTQKCIDLERNSILSAPEIKDVKYLSEWLIVDEAAAMPLVNIQKWVKHFKYVLLVTTLEGYEGSGQAIRLKLLEQEKDVKVYQLKTPIRYANNDPLEQFVDQLSLNYSNENNQNCDTNLNTGIEQFTLSNHLKAPSLNIEVVESLTLARAKQLYCFLRQFHYQTSVNDLRRLFDGGRQYFVSFFATTKLASTESQQQLIGAAWVLNEGGASIKLAKQIWLGRRRPKANLLAQSLSIHANCWFFPCLLGVRISRIGIDNAFRRHQFATQIVQKIIDEAKTTQKDYVSVSFGFTFEIYTFWQKLGFKTVHISHKADASSGLNSIMMIIPLSENASLYSKQCIDEFYDAFIKKTKSYRSEDDFDARDKIFELINPIELSKTSCVKRVVADISLQQALFMICGFALYDRSLTPTRVAFDYFLANSDLLDSDIQIDINKALTQTLTKNELSKFKHNLAIWIEYRYPEFKHAFEAWIDSEQIKIAFE